MRLRGGRELIAPGEWSFGRRSRDRGSLGAGVDAVEPERGLGFRIHIIEQALGGLGRLRTDVVHKLQHVLRVISR
jgi:hypothetical protein